MPHGIISEQLQFSYTENNDYNDQYIPKTLALEYLFISISRENEIKISSNIFSDKHLSA